MGCFHCRGIGIRGTGILPVIFKIAPTSVHDVTPCDSHALGVARMAISPIDTHDQRRHSRFAQAAKRNRGLGHGLVR